MRLLIVEDDDSSRLMLMAVTRKWGYESIEAEDGQQAWDIMQQDNPPLLCLLDWNMPEINGLDLCQLIRTNETNNPPFLLMLTARKETDDIIKGLNAGANDYISKPFEINELQARLQVGQRMIELQEERLNIAQQLQISSYVFSHTREGVLITDKSGYIIQVNDAFTQITGYNSDEVIGKKPRLLQSGEQSIRFYKGMWRNLLKKGFWSGEIKDFDKLGKLFVALYSISSVKDDYGKIKYFIALFSDVTEKKKNEEELNFLAHHDVLTRLPNRLLFNDRLNQAMKQARRSNKQLAVLYLDLDGFKQINDNYSHDVGDQVLLKTSSRMKASLRKVDTLARIGGDEFAAILMEQSNSNNSSEMFQRLLDAASEVVNYNKLELQVSISIGVSFYPQETKVDSKKLLSQADQAMYQAKASGKNCFKIFKKENRLP